MKVTEAETLSCLKKKQVSSFCLLHEIHSLYNKLDHIFHQLHFTLLKQICDMTQCFDEIWDMNLQTVTGVSSKKNPVPEVLGLFGSLDHHSHPLLCQVFDLSQNQWAKKEASANYWWSGREHGGNSHTSSLPLLRGLIFTITILTKVQICSNQSSLKQVIYKIFVSWFF